MVLWIRICDGFIWPRRGLSDEFLWTRWRTGGLTKDEKFVGQPNSNQRLKHSEGGHTCTPDQSHSSNTSSVIASNFTSTITRTETTGGQTAYSCSSIRDVIKVYNTRNMRTHGRNMSTETVTLPLTLYLAKTKTSKYMLCHITDPFYNECHSNIYTQIAQRDISSCGNRVICDHSRTIRKWPGTFQNSLRHPNPFLEHYGAHKHNVRWPRLRLVNGTKYVIHTDNFPEVRC